MSDGYIGEMKLVSWPFPPRGWVSCDGQVLQVAEYTILAGLLGNRFGGDGVNTFALPDMPGRVGIGNGIVQGGAGGEETHTLTLTEMPAHTHTPQCNSGNGDQYGVSGAVWAADSARLSAPYRPGPPNETMHAQSVSSAGGDQSHDNMQPFLTMNWIICLFGIYPSAHDTTPIRRTVPTADGDREFLFQVFLSTREEELAATPWMDHQKEHFLRMQFDAQDRSYRANYQAVRFLLIQDGGRPIGRLYLDYRDDEIRIMDIALLPAGRGRGIGSALLREVLAEAERSGRAVGLHVEQNNPARGPYARIGFVPVSENGVYVLMECIP